MTKISQNLFSKGLVTELSDQLIQADMYDDALNIRLNSDGGNSEYTITNIKGNSELISIPDVPAILTIIPHNQYTASQTGGIYLPNNGSWTHTPVITTTTGTYTGNTISSNDDDSYETFFNLLENELRNNPTFSQFNIARQGQRIRVWSNSLEITNYTSNYLQISIQQPQIDNRIIGWYNINDEIYLICTNDISQTGGIGHFFKLIYNSVTFVPQISLLYSDNLNLTRLQPIYNPGGIEIVYETPDIKRMYWTDRMNDLRSCNLSDVNIMAIPPEQMSMSYNPSLKKPSFRRTDVGGTLQVGMYNISYYLSTGTGARTVMAPPTNDIHVSPDTFVTYQSYQGGENNIITSKSITVDFSQIDTSYSFLNVVVIKRDTENAQTTIYKVAEIPIVGSELQYTYTGAEQASIITEDVFTSRGNVFKICHSIAQKDNILFATNTKGFNYDVDFDARAYRFNTLGECVLNDINGNSVTYNNLLSLATLEETADAINPDQSTYRFQSDGITLGGEGPNVKYEFEYTSLIADITPTIQAHPALQPWRLGNAEINLGDDNLYYQGNFYGSFKSPYMQNIYRSYRRKETYRFFLVPVKNSIEGYAKWIGDIRMPGVWEQPGIKEFPLMHWDTTNNVWYTNSLGVKFTVNIPASISDQIDGFRIKRVKLQDYERSIVAQGIIRNTEYSPDTNKYHLIDITDGNHCANSITPWSSPVGSSLNVFDSPDFIFGKPVQHRAGDTLEPVSGLSATYNSIATVNYPAYKCEWYKLYTEVNAISGFSHIISDARNVGLGDEIQLTTGQPFANRTRNYIGIGAIAASSIDDDHYRADGTDTVVLRLQNNIPQRNGPYSLPSYIGGTLSFSNIGTAFKADKLLYNYVRNTDSFRYGGQGYFARSTNYCIPTGCDVILNGSLQHTVSVYGGDTFVNIFDQYSMVKAWRTIKDEIVDEDFMQFITGNRGTIFMFPVESYVNTELRDGITFISNGYLNTDTGLTEPPPPAEFPLDYGEDYKYNYLYSTENELQKSFPKPLQQLPSVIHPMRIWASGEKILGELSDSWRIFDPQRYIDIDGSLGENRQMINVRDNLMVWQKRGFGIASVNERSVINDNTGGGIIIGQSGVLPRFDYISRQVGAWHQSGFAVSPASVMFWDSKNGSIYSYAEQLKDITAGRLRRTIYDATRGNILNYENPYYNSGILLGCSFAYDPLNREYLFTFHTDTDGPPINGQSVLPRQNSFTIAYSEEKDVFTSFMSFKPSIYISDNQRLLSSNLNDCKTLWLHDNNARGVFYNQQPQNSYFRIVINQDGQYPKIFDNIEWVTEFYNSSNQEVTDQTYTNLLITTPYQSSGSVSNFIRRLRQWKYSIGYVPLSKDRFRAHHCKQQFIFDNSIDLRMICHPIINYYRVVPK